MAKELFIPQLGQTVEQVTIVRWLAADGVQVERGQELLEVETDKAVFPVEATGKGYLHIGPFKEGDVVPVLQVVATIGKQDERWEGTGDRGQGTGDRGQGTVDVTPVTGPEILTPDPRSLIPSAAARLFASPRARRLAAERRVDIAVVAPTGAEGARVVERDVLAYLHQLPKATPVAQKLAASAGVDLRATTGTGSDGRITRGDVERTLRDGPTTNDQRPTTGGIFETQHSTLNTQHSELTNGEAWPAANSPVVIGPSSPEVVERVPLKGVRAIIADRMGASVHTTARVTLMMEVDATELVAMRERLKARVSAAWGFAPGYNDLLAKIVAAALRAFPYMNARLAGDAIERLGQINLGMAVDTERGLLVPVIRDADRKGLRQLGGEFRAQVERARAARSLPDELTGGTFTITNLGMYDVDAFTPVINLPEAAILGVGRIVRKPVVLDGSDAAVVRSMWTLSLVFDHRLVDGGPAARFLQHIKSLIEEPYLLLAE
ncbi:MAG: 2-oxo acid dehydrogenase subunit E2 [Kouleothrix sp.]|nr:2-oxo acid dehydrogenase subunit E2 [Kouleothrix sp.]